MKCSQISTLITLVALCALALGLVAGWLAAYAGNPVVFWSGLVIILVVVAIALRLMQRFTRAFLRDVRRLSEAGRLVLDANPAYRIPPRDTPTFRNSPKSSTNLASVLPRCNKHARTPSCRCAPIWRRSARCWRR